MSASPFSRNDETHFDLIVVGASFAGLITARTAAMRGLKVAVLDGKPEPGARVRTTGILVKEAIDEIDIPAALTRKIRGARLYAPNGKHMDLFAPGYYFLATDTPALLRWLARDAARAGAELYFGARFSSAGVENDIVKIPDLGLTADYLVGADGARSAVARCFGLGVNTEFLVGIEREYEPSEAVDGRFLHCFLDSAIAPGYLGWVVPGANMVQAGLAVKSGRQPNFNAFMERVDPLFDLSCMTPKDQRSGPIPCGGLVKHFASRRVLLTGDAAGLVSPLTGGGIRLAFQFGRRVGQTVSDFLKDGGPEPGEVMAREYPRFALKALMRRTWGIAPPNAVINAALFTPPMRALAEWIYFHKRGTPGRTSNSPHLLKTANLTDCFLTHFCKASQSSSSPPLRGRDREGGVFPLVQEFLLGRQRGHPPTLVLPLKGGGKNKRLASRKSSTCKPTSQGAVTFMANA